VGRTACCDGTRGSDAGSWDLTEFFMARRAGIPLSMEKI
jgi:hypothetical protein